MSPYLYCFHKILPELTLFSCCSATHSVAISAIFLHKLDALFSLKTFSLIFFNTAPNGSIFVTHSFLNLLSVSNPVLWTPGTAQIGEGVENSWGDLEDSEKEEEDEDGTDEAIILDSIKMDTGVEVSNIGSQGR